MTRAELFANAVARIRRDLESECKKRRMDNINALCGALADAVTAVPEEDMPQYIDALRLEMAMCSSALSELYRTGAVQ